MSLHNDIMNIQAKPEIDQEEDAEGSEELMWDYERWYKVGHRDARHVAAELSLKYERALEIAISTLEDIAFDRGYDREDCSDEARKFLREIDQILEEE